MMQEAMQQGEYHIVSISVSRFESFKMVDGRVSIHGQHVVAQEIQILVRQVNLVHLLVKVCFEFSLVGIGVLVSESRFTIQGIHSEIVAWIELVVLMDMLVNQFGNDGKYLCLGEIA